MKNSIFNNEIHKKQAKKQAAVQLFDKNVLLIHIYSTYHNKYITL